MENNVEVSRKHISETYLFGLFNPLAIIERFLEEKFNIYNRFRMIKKTNITKEEYMGIVSSVTDEEDDLPSGQHTMCFNTNMWTSEGSTQPNRKPESINFNQFFSGIHLTSIRHLVCFYHVTFV